MSTGPLELVTELADEGSFARGAVCAPRWPGRRLADVRTVVHGGDGNDVSARRPGDAYLFASRFAAKLAGQS